VASFAFLTATLPKREHLLEQCQASVAAQTVPAQHLVAVDEKREGPAAIRNRLARSTNAEWLIPLDDDDLIDPTFLEVLAPLCGGADVVYPWCRVQDHMEGLPPWTPNRLFRAETLLRFNYIPVTALIRHSLWDKVGGMPERVQTEDWLMWLACLAEGARFRCVPEILWTYRRGMSGSRNQWQTTAA
jgi:glycosyltransferase involved in cell wall biosynthesis